PILSVTRIGTGAQQYTSQRASRRDLRSAHRRAAGSFRPVDDCNLRSDHVDEQFLRDASWVEADFLSRFLDNIRMATSTTSPETPPNIILHQMITGSWVTQAIHVAAELGIADFLSGGPRTAAEIAARVDANADALYRILRALAGIGIFREVDDGRFGQTPISEYLRSDVPGSMRAWARVGGAGWQWRLLGNLMTSARTGKKAGEGLWEHFAENKEDGQVFNQSMTSFSSSEIGPVL